MGQRFFRYELRTTDMEPARAFYSGILGSRFWGCDIALAPLPERAAARGAPAHWLGHVGVGDVEGMVSRIVAAGGKQLGPTERRTDGTTRIVLCDPFGAVLALDSETALPERSVVAWHVLHAEDHELAFAWYAALFGWTATGVEDLGSEMGRHQMFAWNESGPTVGSAANTARLPHIHPQWLFFFRVGDLEASLAKVRAAGGQVLGPLKTPSGDRVAPCNDPQGAAFALYEFARGAS